MSSFDEIIQQKAHSHEAPVPGDVWANIEKKKRRRRFIFFWITITLLLTAFAIVEYYNYKNLGSAERLAVNEANNKINKPDQAEKTGNNEKAGNVENLKGEEQEQLVTNATTNNKKIVLESEGPVNVPDKKDKVDNFNKTANSDGSDGTGTRQTKRSASSKLKYKTVTSARNESSVAKTNPANNDHNDATAPRKKTVKKEKGKAGIKIDNGGIESPTEISKDGQQLAVNAPVKKQEPAEQKITIAEPAPDNNNSSAPLSPVVAKKELTADSTQQKTVAAVPDENKKEKTPPKKQAKKHAWFIDVAATPVLPIRQYDHNVNFNRTLFSNNVKSEFTGYLVNSDIDASVAFSLSVRREFSKRFSAGVGFQYLQLKEHVNIKGTETNTKFTIVDRLVDNANGPQLISDTVETITEGDRNILATNSYNLFSIPVFGQYNFVQNGSWSFGAVAGMFINVSSNYQNEINKNGTGELVNISQAIRDKNKINFSLYGGLRIAKMLNRRMEIFGLPSINWALGNQDVKNNLINQKISRLGFSVGLSYKIN